MESGSLLIEHCLAHKWNNLPEMNSVPLGQVVAAVHFDFIRLIWKTISHNASFQPFAWFAKFGGILDGNMVPCCERRKSFGSISELLLL